MSNRSTSVSEQMAWWADIGTLGFIQSRRTRPNMGSSLSHDDIESLSGAAKNHLSFPSEVLPRMITGGHTVLCKSVMTNGGQECGPAFRRRLQGLCCTSGRCRYHLPIRRRVRGGQSLPIYLSGNVLCLTPIALLLRPRRLCRACRQEGPSVDGRRRCIHLSGEQALCARAVCMVAFALRGR